MIERLRAIFLNDGVLRAIPTLTLIAGLVLFTVAYLLLPAARHPAWHDAVKTLAQSVLVGGLVGVITNSLKYIGYSGTRCMKRCSAPII